MRRRATRSASQQAIATDADVSGRCAMLASEWAVQQNGESLDGIAGMLLEPLLGMLDTP